MKSYRPPSSAPLSLYIGLKTVKRVLPQNCFVQAVEWHLKFFKFWLLPKKFWRRWDGLGWSFGDNTGPMGTHVVATRPMSPRPWAPQNPQNCFFGW